MARQVEIYFKVDGIEQYITNLDDLETALEGVKGATDDVTNATKQLENESAQNFDSIDQRVDTLDGTVKVLAGSLEIATGAIGALGLESNFFDAIQENALNIVLLAQGAINLSEGYKLLRKNAKLAAIAQRALNVVTAANPYVILALAILAAGTALAAYTLKSRDDERAQIKANKARQKAIDLTNKKALAESDEFKNSSLLRRISAQESEEELQKIIELNQNYADQSDARIAAQERIIETQQRTTTVTSEAKAKQTKAINDALKIIEEENKKIKENSVILKTATDRLDELTQARDDAAAAAQANTDATNLEAQALQNEAQAALLAEQVLEDELFLLRQGAEEQEETEAQRLFEERLLRAGENEELIKQAEELFLQELFDINERYRSQEKDAKDASDAEILAKQKEENDLILDAEEQLQLAKFDAIKGGLGLLSSLAGENEKLQNAIFAVDQALAAAEVVINLIKEKSTNAAIYAAAGPAGIVPLAIANTAATIRAGVGLAAIAAASITKFKKGKAPLPEDSTSVNPASVTIPNQRTTQGEDIEIGGGGATNRTAPVLAYVIASDVTSAQQANQQIENLSRL